MTRQQKRAIAIAFVVSVVLFLYAIFNKTGVITMLAKKDDMYAIQRENQRLREENEKLKEELKKLKSDREYLEMLVREKLEVVKDDEILVKFLKNRESSRDRKGENR